MFEGLSRVMQERMRDLLLIKLIGFQQVSTVRDCAICEIGMVSINGKEGLTRPLEPRVLLSSVCRGAVCWCI